MPRLSRKLLRKIALGALTLIVLSLIVSRREEVRAATLLLRFGDAEARGFAEFRAYDVAEENFPLPSAEGPEVNGRLYLPKGLAPTDSGGVVLSHGVHRLGIDEPRLRRFAKSIASSGVVVYTPELVELADYRIDPASAKTIARAATALSKKVARARVGVMGFSFAGGLSMLAAGDPKTNGSIDFVVSIGGYDDLERVLRFFVTSKIEKPSGETVELAAHPYGPLVLVYGHAEDFFAEADLVVARDALRFWLWERRDDARKRAKDASPAALEKLETLFSEKPERLASEIRSAIERHRDLMHAVSPHDHLQGLTVPVFLLHGAGDHVIPATETLWLERDSGAYARTTLVTRAVEHVELQGEPTPREKWELINFMADILRATDAEPKVR